MDVYAAAEDSSLLLSLIDQCPGESFAEVGIGSGWVIGQARFSRKVGSDINPAAIRPSQGCEIVHTAFLDGIEERFDVIAFNPPYLPADVSDRYLDAWERDALIGGKRGVEVALEFLSRIENNLKEGSRIVTISSSFSDVAFFEHGCVSRGYRIVRKEEVVLGFETLFGYILELSAAHRFAIRNGSSFVPFARGKKSVLFLVDEHVAKETLAQGTAREVGILRDIVRSGKAIRVPQVLYADEEFFVMERIQGMSGKDLSDAQRTRIIAQLLDAAISLDELGIKKFEFTRPYGNLIVSGEGSLYLLDFERALRGKEGNVTQFLEFLRRRKYLSDDDARALSERYSHDREGFKGVVIASLRSFTQRVHAVICEVPQGRVATYRDVAHRLDSRAYRAVGRACNVSPGMPHVPCHRIVASDGRLHGFASGLENKRLLLEKEGVVVGGAGPIMRVDLARFGAALV